MSKSIPPSGNYAAGMMVPMITGVTVYADTNTDTSVDTVYDIACTSMSVNASTLEYKLFDIPAGTIVEDIILMVDCAFHADTKLAVTIGDDTSADTYWLDSDMDVTNATTDLRHSNGCDAIGDTNPGAKGGKYYATSDQITITFKCGTTDATLDQGLMRVWIKYWRAASPSY